MKPMNPDLPPRRIIARPLHVRICLYLLLAIAGACLFSGVYLSGAAEAGLPKTALDEISRLEKGEIPVRVRPSGEPQKGWVEAAILIDATVEEIWNAMTDCSGAPGFVPGLEACQVMSAGENWEIIRHDVKWVWFLPRVSYEFRAQYDPFKSIEFERIQGDLREMRGAWRLAPLEGGTGSVVRYCVYLDPGFFIPQFIVRQSLKKDLPAVLEALQAEVSKRRNGP